MAGPPSSLSVVCVWGFLGQTTLQVDYRVGATQLKILRRFEDHILAVSHTTVRLICVTRGLWVSHRDHVKFVGLRGAPLSRTCPLLSPQSNQSVDAAAPPLVQCVISAWVQQGATAQMSHSSICSWLRLEELYLTEFLWFAILHYSYSITGHYSCIPCILHIQ